MTQKEESKKVDGSPKNHGSLILLFMFAVTLLLVVGLSAVALKFLSPQPTVEPEIVMNSAAATLDIVVPVYVDETLKAILPGAISGTLTAIPTLPTPPPIVTEAPIPCDLAGFVSDQTITDGTRISASTAFTKVWLIRNLGSCTWTEDYSLVYSTGDLMAGKSPLTLGRQLAPGDTMEVAANLIAPAASGLYSGYWMFRNGDGATFGVAPDNQALSFTISVGNHGGTAYNFTESACLAEWTSAIGTVKCPETEDFTIGAVNPVESAVGEAGVVFDQPVLEIIPNEGGGGMITGTYGLLQIQPGDSFHAILACADNQPECNLAFELQYDPGDHRPVSLGRWEEVTDGTHHKVSIDLSSLAGQSIRLILSVSSLSDTAYDNKGLWISPVILRRVK